jgi:hypothetical protein
MIRPALGVSAFLATFVRQTSPRAETLIRIDGSNGVLPFIALATR